MTQNYSINSTTVDCLTMELASQLLTQVIKSSRCDGKIDVREAI